MFQLTPAEQLARRLGPADAALEWVAGGPLRQDPSGEYWPVGADPGLEKGPETARVSALLPPGSRTTGLGPSIWTPVPTPDGLFELESRKIDLTDPLTAHLAHLTSGRAPDGPTEILLTRQAMSRLGLAQGDQLQPLDGSASRTVVGVVELPDALREVAVVPPGALAEQPDRWLVEIPGGMSWELVRRLNREGLLVTARSIAGAPTDAGAGQPGLPAATGDVEAISTSVLIGGLGLLEVVLLAGPALAVGARRRRRDLALVAANGGNAAHLRRIVLADGALLGAVGAVVGLALGVTAAIAGRPLTEEYLFQSRAGGVRFYPTALVAIAGLAVLTGLIAALVPAHTAARQDVVASLTGRQGHRHSRRRWLVSGCVLALAGTVVAAPGARQVSTNIVLTGLILAEVGLVLRTPTIVGLLARTGPLLPLAPRIALRDTARNRAAAAPAISAVMAAVAGSVGRGAYESSSQARLLDSAQSSIPAGYVSVSYRWPGLGEPLSADQLAAVAGRHLAVTGLTEIRQPGCPGPTDPTVYCALTVRRPPEHECPYQDFNLTPADQRRALADPRRDHVGVGYYGPALFGVLVDDGAALAALTWVDPDERERASAVLRSGGVVVGDPFLLAADGAVLVEVHDQKTEHPEQAPITIRLPGHALTSGDRLPVQMVGAPVLEQVNMRVVPAGFVISTSTPPDAGQLERLAEELRRLNPQTIVENGGAEPGSADPILLLLAGAAGLITLGAAGMATGLAAAEGRADLSALAAIGASPGVRRTLSLSQAGVIAGLGSLLGIAAGLCAAAAILTALNQGNQQVWPVEPPYPLLVPWKLLGVLVVVPMIAMLGAGLMTPSRLPVERRLD